MMVLTKLRQIREGQWLSNVTKRLQTPEPGCQGLELWRTKWSQGGRIIFEVPSHPGSLEAIIA